MNIGKSGKKLSKGGKGHFGTHTKTNSRRHVWVNFSMDLHTNRTFLPFNIIFRLAVVAVIFFFFFSRIFFITYHTNNIPI
jgi:hypothetical protein